MFVKSLRVKGFKSFADKTDLEFTPGITCVVGPNGSGKSNVVDALVWVLGVQGARQLRGASMEDVIFSGTPARPQLGRAEVVLTLDNSAGQFPIDLAEIALGRVLFRSGDSRYSINGEACRLVDIIELLSDAGVGRQMHNIVGQGRVESILLSGPEERRTIIEEAAGILKHRRRREKALRQIESVEVDLVRLGDLKRELMRQLKPIERQVEGARRYETLTTQMRALKLWLAGQAIRRHRKLFEELTQTVQLLRARHMELEQKLRANQEAFDQSDSAAQASAQEVDGLRNLRDRADRVVNKLVSLQQLLHERLNSVRARLESIGDMAGGDAVSMGSRLEIIQAELVELEERQGQLEDQNRNHQLSVQGAQRERTDFDAQWRASGLDDDDRRTVLETQLHTMQASIERASSDLARLEQRKASLADRSHGISTELASLQEAMVEGEWGVHGGVPDPLTARLGRLEHLRTHVEAEATAIQDHQENWTQRSAQLRGWADSLAAQNAQTEGRLKAADEIRRRIGECSRLCDVIEVTPGWEKAVATALGDALEALLIPTGQLRTAIEAVKSVMGSYLTVVSADALVELGGVSEWEIGARPQPGMFRHCEEPALGRQSNLVRGSTPEEAGHGLGCFASLAMTEGGRVALPPEARSLTDLVRAKSGSHRQVTPVLARYAQVFVFVEDAAIACGLAGQNPTNVFVTRDGDYFHCATFNIQAATGAHVAVPALELPVERRQWAVAEKISASVELRVQALRRQLDTLRESHRASKQQLNELKANQEANKKREARLVTEDSDLKRELEAIDRQVSELTATISGESARKSELEIALAASDPHERDQIRAELESRRAEIDQRVVELANQGRSLESDKVRVAERRRAVDREQQDLENRLRQHAERATKLAYDQSGLEQSQRQLDLLQAPLSEALTQARRRFDHLADLYTQAQSARNEVREAFGRVQAEQSQLRNNTTQAGESLRVQELSLAEARLRLEAAEELPQRELGIDVAQALAAQLPEEFSRTAGFAGIDSPPLGRNFATRPSAIASPGSAGRGNPGFTAIASEASNSEWFESGGGPAASPQMDPHALAGARAQDDERGEWLLEIEAAVSEALERVERELRSLGPVNPLALEEHKDLAARRDELESELSDVVAAKKDITKVVREVDRQISDILTDAYADVSRHFSDLFALLFPGGEGRLTLTDPEEVMDTGIELEVRPSGKTMKRLSLLSGGERALCSLAFLFAIFRARPSPFYVLDEVEASLDDLNLHRFCLLLREFRKDGQILVVTHQKRTMEIADVLYGVTLRTDGTSRVLSHKIAELDLTDDALALQG